MYSSRYVPRICCSTGSAVILWNRARTLRTLPPIPPPTTTSNTNAPSQPGTTFNNRFPCVSDPTWTTTNLPRFPGPSPEEKPRLSSLGRWHSKTYIPYSVQSTFRRFEMTSSSSGTLSNPSLRLVMSKSTASKLSMAVWSDRWLRKAPDNRSRSVPRGRRSSSQLLRSQIFSITSVSTDQIPFLHLKRRMGAQWEHGSGSVL
jgi:hypothetical protein